MAYINKHFATDKQYFGPYPNKAGEFVCNELRDDLRIGINGVVLEWRVFEEFEKPVPCSGGQKWQTCKNKRIGRPAKCQIGTSAEMAAWGNVGLYLIADVPLSPFDIYAREIDTDVLMEEVVSGLRPPQKPIPSDIPLKS